MKTSWRCQESPDEWSCESCGEALGAEDPCYCVAETSVICLPNYMHEEQSLLCGGCYEADKARDRTVRARKGRAP